MSGPADKIRFAVAQPLVRLVDRKHEFEFDVQALLLEEAELNRRDGRKVGVRDQIGNDDLHAQPSSGNDTVL